MNIIEEEALFQHSKIGNFSWVRLGTKLVHSTIGDDVFIGFQCDIQNTIIKNNVQIASKTSIGSPQGKKTVIEECVWIGADAVISDGVTVGKGSVIGAGTIINQDVAPYSVVIGQAPNQRIKNRSCIEDAPPEFREFFLEILNHKVSLVRWTQTKSNFISSNILNVGNYTLGNGNIFVGKRVANFGGIEMGNDVTIGDGNIFEGQGGIKIGSNVKIGSNIHIVSNSHDYHYLSLPKLLSPVHIHDGAVIGDGAVILGGVEIGEGAVIKENSIIVKNVPGNTVVRADKEEIS